jgi:hypothetical protein
MARRRSATLQFNAIRLVGGLLPASLIEQIARQEAPGQKASDYGLPKNLRIQVAVDQAWSRARALWQEAKELRSRGEGTPWRVWFSSRLLREVFGWEDLESCEPRRIEEALYPISHQGFGGKVPVVLTPVETGLLDQGSKAYGQDGRRRSPHSCLQECLNADDSSEWGVLCNGSTLRLLHDNPALVKPAYVQVELGGILNGGLFDEFAVLWLLVHASRFAPDGEGHCRLDAWLELGQQSGERALTRLRDGVQSALEVLGEGFLRHPANQELRCRLEETGELSTMDFFRQVLRLVYRLLFLCSAEDRELLFPPGVPFQIQQVYHEGYSLSRLRDLAIRSGAQEHQHSDLWKVQVLMFRELEKETGSELGLPALGGLFNHDRCPDLDSAQLSNAALLTAVRAIGWFYDEQSQSRTRINYAAMNTEEFGSVYESLLELHPQIRPQGGALRFSLGGVAGSERKTSGSYYTPEDLVRLLILSALLPVIRERVGRASTMEDKAQALLAIRVLDPACGSGHFLLAAARRLALELARILAGDDEPGEDLRRHCLREVVAKCLYGVDKNPMAIELCKVALWIEAIEPGKPLGFLDAHIQCGDSLVGVFDPKVLEEGIPDGAYKPLTGDNPVICKSLRNYNRKQREAYQKTKTVQPTLDLFAAKAEETTEDQLAQIEALSEETLKQTIVKQQRYELWQSEMQAAPDKLLADLYTAAFFLQKDEATQNSIPLTEHILIADPIHSVPQGVKNATREAAKDFNFFHWHLCFSHVIQRGGFDCVLGNPPWDRVKPQEGEFFEPRLPEYRTAKGSKARSALLRDLEDDQSQAAKLILADWRKAKRYANSSANFARFSNRFPLTGSGELNAYSLFAELNISAIGLPSRCGIVVPTGIVTDMGNSPLLQNLLDNKRLLSVVDFENKRKIFRSVHAQYRFALLTCGSGNGLISGHFMLSSVTDLALPEKQVTLSGSLLKSITPFTVLMPTPRSRRDSQILEQISASNAPLTSNAEHQLFSQQVVFRRMFRKPDDNDIMIDPSLADLQTIKHTLPLFEGENCAQYQFFDRPRNESGSIGNKLKGELKIPVLTEYLVSEEAFHSKINSMGLDLFRSKSALLGIRRVTNSTNERTSIASVFPFAPVSASLILALGIDAREMALLQGILNSLVFDYILRMYLSQPSLPQVVLEQIPVPKKSNAEQYLGSIIKLSTALSAANGFLGEWAREVGVSETSVDDSLLCRALIDVYVAKAYGLSLHDFRYILSPTTEMGSDYPSESFRQFEAEQIRCHGSFRYRDVIVKAWNGT